MSWEQLVLELSAKYTVFGYIASSTSLAFAIVFGWLKYKREKAEIESKEIDNEIKRIELNRLKNDK